MSTRWEPALRELVHTRYGSLLARATLASGARTDAADLVHDALLSTFSSRARFDSVAQAEQYVCRAIMSRSVDRVRRRGRERAAIGRVAGMLPDAATDPDPDVLGEDVVAALAELSPRQRAWGPAVIDDLSTRLTAGLEALEAREAATRPDDAVVAGLHRGVRRRRAFRRARQGTAVATFAAVVVGTAWVGWGALQPDPVPPAETTDPVPTETSSPSPTPTEEPTSQEPTPDATTEGLVPVDIPRMPPLFELTPAVLAEVGPDWAAVFYTDLGGDPVGTDGDSTGSAMVLVSPEDEMYLALHDPEGGAMYPVRWDGTATLVVSIPRDAGGLRREVLSLVTGTLSPDDRGLPGEASYLGTRPDGTEVWQTQPGAALWVVPADGPATELRAPGSEVDGYVLAPDGARAVVPSGDGLLMVDLTTGAETRIALPAGVAGRIVGWSAPDEMLVMFIDGAGRRLVRMDPAGQATVVREYAAGDALPWKVQRVGDEVLASLSPPDAFDPWCTTSVARLAADGSTSELTIPGRQRDNVYLAGGSVDTGTAVISEGWCGGDGGGSVHLMEAGTGSIRVLPEGPGARPLSPAGVAVLR